MFPLIVSGPRPIVLARIAQTNVLYDGGRSIRQTFPSESQLSPRR